MINMKNFLTNATRNRDTPLRFLNPSTDEMSSVPLGVIAIPHVLIIERDFFVVEFVDSAGPISEMFGATLKSSATTSTQSVTTSKRHRATTRSCGC